MDLNICLADKDLAGIFNDSFLQMVNFIIIYILSIIIKHLSFSFKNLY